MAEGSCRVLTTGTSQLMATSCTLPMGLGRSLTGAGGQERSQGLVRVEWWLRWSLAGEGREAGIGAGLKKG